MNFNDTRSRRSDHASKEREREREEGSPGLSRVIVVNDASEERGIRARLICPYIYGPTQRVYDNRKIPAGRIHVAAVRRLFLHSGGL